MLAAGPKSYGCIYENNDGSKSYEKIKFKGIPSNALINNKTLSFDNIQLYYKEAG
jgi:hypothetical protein